MDANAKLLKTINRFLKDTGMTATDFGLLSVGRRDLMTRMKAGKGVTLQTAADVEAFMATYKKKRFRVVETASA